MNKRLHELWAEYKRYVLFIVLMVMFRGAVADWNPVPTGSMLPTIVEGDVILVNKLAYDIQVPFFNTSLIKLDDPERGDIVIFKSKASDLRLVKRVIGVPGDTLEMNNNQLIINGKKLNYSNANYNSLGSIDVQENLFGLDHDIRVSPFRTSQSSFNKVVIPEDYYFTMGDNRDNSADSRVIGFVPRDEIIGRTKRLLLSFNMENNYLPRKERFFHTL